MISVAGRIAGIAVCGVLGAMAGALTARWLEVDGVLGALLASALAMLVGTAAFAGWTVLGRLAERRE